MIFAAFLSIEVEEKEAVGIFKRDTNHLNTILISRIGVKVKDARTIRVTALTNLVR